MKIRGIIFIVFLQVSGILSDSPYDDVIVFQVYKGNVFNHNSTFDDNDTLLAVCDPMEPITIIIHGYTETTATPWAFPLFEKLGTHRGGCIFWMDYSYFAAWNYLAMIQHFSDIQKVLTRKLQQLDENGYKLEDGLMFGFSFGVYLALEAAYQFGPGKFGQIDGCEPANPGFTSSSDAVVHAPTAAKRVQCIHTSADAGTAMRFCQKSINMGKCGSSQKANSLATWGAHGLCPMFYTEAFENDFKLVKQSVIETRYTEKILILTIPAKCYPKQNTPDVTNINAKMGYYLDFAIPNGEYFADTRKDPPYNVL